LDWRVKHLHPRQGITTYPARGWLGCAI